MLWVLILILIVVGATIHSFLPWRGATRRGRAVELFLVYLLTGYYGVAMALAGVVNLLNPVGVAELKGWVASEPIQTLYAFALFGLAASAVQAVWRRGSYLLAPAVSGSVLLLGGAYVHGSEIVRAGKFVWIKDGPEVLLDFVVPVTVLALAFAYWQSEGSKGV